MPGKQISCVAIFPDQYPSRVMPKMASNQLVVRRLEDI
jgi:hypothetical protein